MLLAIRHASLKATFPGVQGSHDHFLEVNNQFIDAFENAGMIISGRSKKDNLVEMIELKDHPWFVGCQFHPEFTSTPRDGHPLFTSYIEAALIFKKLNQAAITV